MYYHKFCRLGAFIFSTGGIILYIEFCLAQIKTYHRVASVRIFFFFFIFVTESQGLPCEDLEYERVGRMGGLDNDDYEPSAQATYVGLQ